MAHNTEQVQVEYVQADAALRERIAREWGDVQARHMHVDDGFTIVALSAGKPVGLLAVGWRELPEPFAGEREAFIDIIEVRLEFRRRGIASRMIGMAAWRGKSAGAYQLRAWSSDDRLEGLAMWRALGFGLAPATVYPGGKEVRGFFVTKVL